MHSPWGWESSCPHALLKASAVLRRGAVDGMGSAPAWGGARASASKKRGVGLGTVARGAVDRCSGMGRCTGVGVEEEERRAGNVWCGVEIFQPAVGFYTKPHHCRF